MRLVCAVGKVSPHLIVPYGSDTSAQDGVDVRLKKSGGISVETQGMRLLFTTARAEVVDEGGGGGSNAKDDDMVHSAKMGGALKILERMVNQNAEDEIFQDFKYWEVIVKNVRPFS